MGKNKIIALIKVLAASIALVGAVSIFVKQAADNGGAADNGYYLYDFAMGTSVSLQLFGDVDITKGAAEKIYNEIKRLDKEIISWRNTESGLGRVNSEYIPLEGYALDDELSYIIRESLELCAESEGALDITIRELANLWGIEDTSEEDFMVPDSYEINSVLKNSGYNKVHIEGNILTIDNAGIMLDLGAVGKGCALDYARNILLEYGAFTDEDYDMQGVKYNSVGDDYSSVEGAIISVGGSILVIGSKSDGAPWKVGIRNPKGNIDDMLGYVELEPDSNKCISTSGDYEKYIEKGGVRYHHILDMSTGYPADTNLSSVTVVCENGLVSDGLSTACFVLGYEGSKEILERYDAEAIFIDRDNNVKVTGGLKFISK